MRSVRNKVELYSHGTAENLPTESGYPKRRAASPTWFFAISALVLPISVSKTMDTTCIQWEEQMQVGEKRNGTGNIKTGSNDVPATAPSPAGAASSGSEVLIFLWSGDADIVSTALKPEQ
jgi:hypothetical protein